MSFAPPASLNVGSTVPDDATGEDAYTRRMRLSATSVPNQSMPEASAMFTSMAPPSQHFPQPPPPPPPPMAEPLYQTNPPPPPSASAQPQPAPMISRAPVRYNLPPPPSDIPKSEAELENALKEDEAAAEEETASDAPRSLRPGQRGFAERLLSKYGWTKGSGLGASGSGIVNPLRVQVEKQKKKPDSEGGGFVGPGGRGKIIGGKKKGGVDAEPELGKFGAMSEIVILRGMVDGMDLDAEMEGSGDGGIMQEIGEECSEKVRLNTYCCHGV